MYSPSPSCLFCAAGYKVTRNPVARFACCSAQVTELLELITCAAKQQTTTNRSDMPPKECAHTQHEKASRRPEHKSMCVLRPSEASERVHSSANTPHTLRYVILWRSSATDMKSWRLQKSLRPTLNRHWAYLSSSAEKCSAHSRWKP